MDARDKETFLRQLEGYRWLERERIQRLRQMSPEERLRLAIELNIWARNTPSFQTPDDDEATREAWSRIRTAYAERAA
jgi:hypothetical protein